MACKTVFQLMEWFLNDNELVLYENGQINGLVST